MFRRMMLPLLLAPLFVLAACDDDCYEDDDDFEVVEQVPTGGDDFGLLDHFGHDFADRDISASDDQDGFTFTLAQDSLVVVTMTGVGGFDGYLDLYTAGFSFVAGDSNGGPGDDPVLVGVLDAGDYFVVAGGEYGVEGDYGIDISVEPLGGADFGIMTVPDSLIDTGGDISDSLDVDSFVFTIESSAVVDVFLTRTSGNYDGNLELLDEYGNQVAFIDAPSDNDPEILAANLGAGTYIVRVGAGSGFGDYTLQVDTN